MSTPAIISGDLTTFKHVPTRKVYQLIVEIPAEAASAAFATLGMPGTVSQIPVAVARLNIEATAKAEPTKERRSFTELPYAQQAAMRCQEREFQLYVADFLAPSAWQSLSKRSEGRTPADVAAQLVRDWCRVTSRSDIIKGTQAGDNWEHIEGDFYAHQHGRRA
jgi:hypothetical protein